MNNNIKTLCELTEGANECSKLLILSQLALDNGDLNNSQKYFLQTKDILKTLTSDTFNEIKELTNSNVLETVDYDISSLNLACLLNDGCYYASILIAMENEEDKNNLIKESVVTKLIKILNSCTELYNILFI